mmetsp:Transcript_36035/g.66868  ORF Transcript_36035/g.66868 Transcript_36035/m.66868 type:complete len:81 (-) Transcript_36035:209-451(-)
MHLPRHAQSTRFQYIPGKTNRFKRRPATTTHYVIISVHLKVGISGTFAYVPPSEMYVVRIWEARTAFSYPTKEDVRHCFM